MSDFNISPQERQLLISMYVTQYNQTNTHITRLFDTLDNIRNNINYLIGNNMNRTNQTNLTNQTNRSSTRGNRNNRQNNLNTFVNPNSARNSRSGPFIHYDYNNPIERSTYINEFMSDLVNGNTANIQNHENNPHITDFLTTFFNSVPVRPTMEQINAASRLVRYSDISNPNSAACAISLEPFEPDDTVRQLHHCGHIFLTEQFNQWFSNNVRCPVCRHDIRLSPSRSTIEITSTPETTDPTSTSTSSIFNSTSTSTSNSNPINNIVEQLTMDISNNEISNNLLSSITSRFLTNLLNPSSNSSNSNSRTNNDRIIYDPVNDALIFEAILRPNNN